MEYAFSAVEGAWGYKATTPAQRDTTRIVNRGGMQCLELTVDISWHTMLREWSGKQVYTLCPDGTSYYQG